MRLTAHYELKTLHKLTGYPIDGPKANNNKPTNQTNQVFRIRPQVLSLCRVRAQFVDPVRGEPNEITI